MPNRRQFIRCVTATTTLSGISIVGASKPEEQGLSSKDQDLGSKIFQTYVKGGPELVGRRLDRDGIAHTQTTTKVSSSDSGKNDSQIGTNMHYTESGAEMNVILTERPEYNRILCTANMKMDNVDSAIRNAAYSPDVIGIGFDNNEWTAVGSPSVVATAIPDDGSNEADFWSGSIDGGGVAAEVYLEKGLLPETSYISLQSDFVTDGHPGTLWGSYKHTFAFGPSGSIESISGGGPIGVTLDWSSVVWDEMTPKDPEPVLP